MKRPDARDRDALLRAFLAEDLGSGDVTSDATVPDSARARGELVARSECVVSGLDVARRVFELLDPGIEWRQPKSAGDRAEPGAVLATLSGRARPVLAGERVALNLLQRMCGIATATRRFADAV
jgi:nicotinate-nucleotide pyrophosphorylase (carboxylating)